MITIAFCTVVGADHARVWRAIVDPRQVMSWDSRIVAPAGETPRAPSRPGDRLRWRCRLGGVEMVRDELALEVVPERRLRTRIGLGTLRLERSFSLAPEPEAPERTRVSLALRAGNSVPVYGAVIDRFGVRRIAAELGNETLRALQAWCEAGTVPADAQAGGRRPLLRLEPPPP